ncbi:response regulator [Wenzhouxiangella marina]|uniref:Uncharacterized protein n=1 Tax=Wenzhouxiangella marina TaxID=1579979 RepID=A0A0K0XUT2_9GAMM|nr:response regulator [Wenzhouxiangella marina]AKS41382.1 hypothetical protein WM2015_1005 [Wenzhouxiangella marina]MBB6086864.1 response regulator RpfG family c-di-GMP phosphodiesterase [Wenzhouxiangella marina]
MSIISWDEFRRQQQGEYELTITPDELRIGDFIVRVDTLDGVPPITPRGQRVESFDQKQLFQRHCKRVVIDLQRCLNRRTSGTEASLSSAGALPRLTGKLDALRNSEITATRLVEAWQVYRRLSLVAQAQILSFHRHGHIDVADAKDAVEELLEAVPDHLACLIWFTHIKEPSRYAFQHGLNTALLTAGLAHAAGWTGKVAETLVLAALTHDLGMMRISLQTLRKKDALSAAERDHIRLHTRMGHELLAQNDGLPDAVASVALYHHEQADGRGYPEGLTREGIPAMARLVSVISAYQAMTTPRFHHGAMSHQQALGELWKLRGKQFDEEAVDAFSKFLGWAPPGTLMRLADGRRAVALHAVDGQRRPLVRLLHHRGEEFVFGVEIDLNDGPVSAGADGQGVVLLADGSGGVKHRELTRKLPPALAPHTAGTADESSPTQPRRERRQRPRVDAPRGTRILVVDDSRTIRESLRHMLEQSGYRIHLAESGEQGLELAERERPDLIILDIILPDISGFRALRRLRKHPGTRDLPVIMISGNSGAVEKFFLQRVGADDFIQKPFGRFEAFSAIERLIRAGALGRRLAG